MLKRSTADALPPALLAGFSVMVYLAKVGDAFLGRLLVATAFLLATAYAHERLAGRRPAVRLALPVWLAVVASYAAWRFLAEPVLWTFFVAAALARAIAQLTARPLRVIAANVVAIFVVFGLVEVLLMNSGSDGKVRQSFTISGQPSTWWVPDADLGYRHPPGEVLRERKDAAGRELYSAAYTIGDDGLRSTGNGRKDAPRVLFFGDSFTFGQGVSDGEAFPAVFERASGGRFRAINMAAIGYGAHQALAAVADRRVDTVLAGARPAAAYYVAIPDHVERAAGLKPWDLEGPCFVITDSGILVRAGQFDSTWQGRLRGGLVRWRLFRTLLALRGRNDQDERRYVAIVSELDRQLRQRYGIRLRVLFWDDPRSPRHSVLVPRLREAGLETEEVSTFAPDLFQHSSRYYLPDWHPNRAAHRAVGEFVARELSRGDNRGTGST